jgi:hypothetical protein
MDAATNEDHRHGPRRGSQRWFRIVATAIAMAAASNACAVASEPLDGSGVSDVVHDTRVAQTDAIDAPFALDGGTDVLRTDAHDAANRSDVANDALDADTPVDVVTPRDVSTRDVVDVVDVVTPRDVVAPRDVGVADVGACTSGVPCTPSNPCHAGATDCSSGSSVCRDTGTNLANGTACGSGRICTAGACVCNDRPCRLACGSSVVNACGEVVSCACPATRPRCCGDLCVCSSCVCP